MVIYWLSLSGCQNNYSLGINFDKTVISFFVFLNLPSHHSLKIIAQWLIIMENKVVIYLWYDKPHLNAFSKIWNLDRLQNKHKQKEPNFPEFPNFLSVQIRNKISKSITVNQHLFFGIQKWCSQYRYCFDLLQRVLLILIQAMQKYKITIKTFFINYWPFQNLYK